MPPTHIMLRSPTSGCDPKMKARDSMKILRTALVIGVAGFTLLGVTTAGAQPMRRPRPNLSGMVERAESASSPESVAVASPWGLADTRYDVPYASGDITAVKAEHLTNTVRLTVRTRGGSNPSTSDSWVHSSYTFLGWGIDVNNDGQVDFMTLMWNDGIDVQAEVVRNNASHTHTCWADWSHPSGTVFTLSFARGCIASHLSFRVFALMDYDRYPFGPQPVSEDASPNTVWSPRITR